MMIGVIQVFGVFYIAKIWILVVELVDRDMD
jgi:hypothetical protein